MSEPERTTIYSADGTPLIADLAWVDEGLPGIAVVHGLDSTRVNHRDFMERLNEAGMNAVAVDLRGHGESEGRVGPGLVDDVLAALDLLAERGAGPLGLRGSSMGGLLALHAAAHHPSVRAVVAICPANHVALADRRPDLECARQMDPQPIVAGDDGIARGYWHARGDEVIPWEWSSTLYEASSEPRSLHLIDGGDHRSLQHDPAVQADTVAFLTEHLDMHDRTATV